MSKITVMSWKILTPPGKLPVSMSIKIIDAENEIRTKPFLIKGFTRSFKQMLEKGNPASSSDGIPSFSYQPALSLLNVFVKRFNVAVALARITFINSCKEERQKLFKMVCLNPSDANWLVAADNLAVLWVLNSARELDLVDHTIAFQGILFALSAQGIIEKSISGFNPPEGIAAQVRSINISKFFLDYLTSMGMTEKDALNCLNGAEFASKTLDLLWQTAIKSEQLNLADVQPSKRWHRNIIND